MKTIIRKNMLYKSKVEYMSGEGVYSMNHVLGCSHGCKYPCYAYLTAKRFGQVESYEDWCEPKLVENTLELLDRELFVDRREPIRRVHLCFTTDPFMYGQETVQDSTLAVFNFINRNCGIPITCLTKGAYPRAYRYPLEYADGTKVDAVWFERRQDLKGPLHPDNEYGISLSSLDEGFRARWEPGAAPYAERIASLKALHDVGCRTWVSMEPWMEPVCYGDPTRRDCDFVAIAISELKQVLREVTYVNRIVFGRINHAGHKKLSPLLDDYYHRCADIVRGHCKTHGIECVIKEGTE